MDVGYRGEGDTISYYFPSCFHIVGAFVSFGSRQDGQAHGLFNEHFFAYLLGTTESDRVYS